MLTIGELARQTKCKVQTIRYYEKIGLLPLPDRTIGNQRRYGKDHRDRLAFIRQLGLPLTTIRELLNLIDNPNRSCGAADAVARAQLEQVERRIVRLEALRDEFKRMIVECDGGRVADCRVIQVLADHTHSKCVSDSH